MKVLTTEEYLEGSRRLAEFNQKQIATRMGAEVVDPPRRVASIFESSYRASESEESLEFQDELLRAARRAAVLIQNEGKTSK